MPSHRPFSQVLGLPQMWNLDVSSNTYSENDQAIFKIRSRAIDWIDASWAMGVGEGMTVGILSSIFL